MMPLPQSDTPIAAVDFLTIFGVYSIILIY